MDAQKPNPGLFPLRRGVKIACGVLLWLGILGGGFSLLSQGKNLKATLRAGEQMLGTLREVEVEFPAGTQLSKGSRVRVESKDGLIPAGQVIDLQDAGKGRPVRARLAIYPDYESALDETPVFTAYETTGDIAWVLKTLFPAPLREEIRELLLRRWAKERDRLLREMRPGLSRLGDDMARALRDDFPRVYEAHREEFETIGNVVKEKAWKDHIEANFREEVWPRVETKATPLVAEISEELIEAFPLFDFSWTYLLQKLDFSSEKRVQKELRRFLEEKGIPIVTAHNDDFRKAAVEVFRDTLASDSTRRALEEALFAVAHDPRFREALSVILSEWLVENEKVREILNGLWEREDLRRPLEGFFDRLTPDIHRVANRIILNDSGKGIDPELARILRRKLLREDERWVLLGSEGKSSSGSRSGAFVGSNGGIR